MKRVLAHLISHVGPCGYSPVAPGTAGSFAAFLGFIAIGPQVWWFHLFIIVGLFFVGVWACNVEEERLGKHDAGCLVIDEVVGFWITAFLVPYNWKWLLVAFLVFRIFDIVKPYPVNLLDKKVKKGFGVMIDDVGAGLYGMLAMLLLQSWPWFRTLLEQIPL